MSPPFPPPSHLSSLPPSPHPLPLGQGCALISIPGRAFPVTPYFLEDAIEQTAFKLPPGSDCLFGAKGERDPVKRKAQVTARAARLQALQKSVKPKVGAAAE